MNKNEGYFNCLPTPLAPPNTLFVLLELKIRNISINPTQIEHPKTAPTKIKTRLTPNVKINENIRVTPAIFAVRMAESTSRLPNLSKCDLAIACIYCRDHKTFCKK